MGRGGLCLGEGRAGSRAIDVLGAWEDAESGQAPCRQSDRTPARGQPDIRHPSGFEALIEIGERRPDVLITDLGVAGLDFFRMVHLEGPAREQPDGGGSGPPEADRAGVRERLPEDVAVIGLPAENANLAARVWALLKDVARKVLSAGAAIRRWRPEGSLSPISGHFPTAAAWVAASPMENGVMVKSEARRDGGSAC